MPLVTQELITQASQNLEALGSVINGPNTLTVTTPLGQSVPTISKVMMGLQAQAFQILTNPTLLRAYSKPNDVGAVILVNLTNSSDYEGGVYYWDSAATDLDNGVDFIKPNSVSGAGRWVRLKALVSSSTLEDVGITPGLTYDVTSLFATFETQVSGGVVDLRGGTYTVTTIPTGNVYINGFWKLSALAVGTRTDNIFPSQLESRLAVAHLATDGPMGYSVPQGNLLANSTNSSTTALSGTGYNSGARGGGVTFTNKTIYIDIPGCLIPHLRGKGVCIQWTQTKMAGRALTLPLVEVYCSRFPEDYRCSIGGMLRMSFGGDSNGSGATRTTLTPFWHNFVIPDGVSSVCFKISVSDDIDNFYVTVGSGPAKISGVIPPLDKTFTREKWGFANTIGECVLSGEISDPLGFLTDVKFTCVDPDTNKSTRLPEVNKSFTAVGEGAFMVSSYFSSGLDSTSPSCLHRLTYTEYGL